MSEFKKRELLLPYEKCKLYGPASLSDAELLAVIIRSGTKNLSCLEIASKLLESFGDNGILGLVHADYTDFLDIPGIGEVKSVMLLCLREINSRIIRADKTKLRQFCNVTDVADYYMESMRHLESENFRLMLLDSNCCLVHETLIGVGSINSACFSIREVLKCALKNNAVYIIVVHNHPSGNPTPSEEDEKATMELYEAALMVGLSLIDHVIIGDKRFFSFKEHNLL